MVKRVEPEKDSLSQLRKEISNLGKSEFQAIEDQPALEDIVAKIQTLRTEMNKAKKLASEEAAKPYLEQIKTLEEEYAFFLKLSVN